MKVLIAGGGTAGHINPAIAVANTIKAHDEHAEIAFIGTAHGLENELVKKAGYPIYHIEMSGLQRSFSLRNIKTAYCYITAPIKAKKLIKKFGPDVVFGTGGYLSYPLIKAAGALGVPSALHESNALVGKAIQMLSGTVNKIYLNFESAAEQIRDKSKVEVVGNPLISESDVLPSSELKRKLGIPIDASLTVLSFGGSLGSEKIADAVIATAKKFKEDGRSVYFVHSAGSRKYDSAYKKASESGMTGADNFRLEKYIYNMPEWEACADIVICRAGAMTLSEIAAAGKAAIIVPSPYVAENHQFINAKQLADAGAAVLIEEKELTSERLERELDALISSEKKRLEMSAKIRAFAHPDAREAIYAGLCELASRGAESR